MSAMTEVRDGTDRTEGTHGSVEPMGEMVEGLPNFCGGEDRMEEMARRQGTVFLERTPFRLERLQSAFGLALHMHQPLILEDGDMRTAPIINNLQWMMERQHIHGNHDAPVFASCYSRIADFIRELVDAGRHPRVMLDYSGCLLVGLRQMGRGDILENLKTVVHNERYWPCVELVDAGRHPRVMLDYSGCLLFGLRQMGRGDILENLKTVVHNDRYWPCVEWLGTMWGHAVAPT